MGESSWGEDAGEGDVAMETSSEGFDRLDGLILQWVGCACVCVC